MVWPTDQHPLLVYYDVPSYGGPDIVAVLDSVAKEAAGAMLYAASVDPCFGIRALEFRFASADDRAAAMPRLLDAGFRFWRESDE